MSSKSGLRGPLSLSVYALKWVALATPTSLVIGSACALFLVALERVTEYRVAHPWLLYLLPLAGVAIVLAYRHFGGDSHRGNNLILDEIHDRTDAGVPARMGPFVLVATLVTHLFGGSAGREGTAVQIGGSVAAEFARRLRLSRDDVRVMLMVGIAAGFGGVFGTPVAGAVFAMEVLVVGRIAYDAVWPCLVAAFAGDVGCRWWGVHHTDYARLIEPGGAADRFAHVDARLAIAVAIAAVAFGGAAALFAGATHGVQRIVGRTISRDWLRPIVGGLVVIGLTWVVGTRDYLGIGVVPGDATNISITTSFAHGGATTFSWLWKLVFTAVTLGSGFKGGEVTPLFFVGATLGHAVAQLGGLPIDLFAAVGFVAVFAGATQTPLACTLMGVELFGPVHPAYFAIACFVAFLFSGHRGIYAAQRGGMRKGE